MRAINSLIVILLLTSRTLYSQKVTEKYLGEIPPGNTPQIFTLDGYFDIEDNRKRSFNLTFSPDGTEMFFSYVKEHDEKLGTIYEIKTSQYINGKWKEPETASFSGEYWDVDINFSPDGQYVFFASDRPQPNAGDGDIYYSVKTCEGWSEPILTGADVSSPFGEVYPSVSEKNNLFFRSTRPGGFGADDLYRAKWINGNFIEAENLGPNINTEHGESNAVIAPDESYILFCSSRPEEGNIQQIFISFQTGDNVWTKAQSIESQIGTGPAGAPTLTCDGKFLFFKNRTGIMWVSTKFIDELKKSQTEKTGL